MAIPAAAQLVELYEQMGESVTLAGSPITAIFDGGYVEALGMSGTAPTLRCIASQAPASVIGQTAVRGAITYIVRGREPLPPDELEVRLILERQ